MNEQINLSRQRSSKGSIVTFLLILAAFGLMFVVGIIAAELLIKWVTFGRIQTATQAAALAFGREMIKLRDNEMGGDPSRGIRPNPNLRFQTSMFFRNCRANGRANANGQGYAGCTPTDETDVTGNRPAAGFVEFVNASQVLLFPLRNLSRGNIRDASEIRNINFNQCYTQAANTRFRKFRHDGVPNCAGGEGDVMSPITELQWDFYADAYGQGVCNPVPAGDRYNTDKDFCVEAEARGRLDPIMAGGLPFLTGIGVFDTGTMAANRRDPTVDLGAGRKPSMRVNFIYDGDFAVRSRAIVMLGNFKVDDGTQTDFSRQYTDQYYSKGAENFSTETIALENCTSNKPNCN